MKRIWITGLMILLLSACSNSMEFSKEKWQYRNDPNPKHRKEMLEDLTQNHLHQGMKYKEILSLLGKPDYAPVNDSMDIGYSLYVDYAWDNENLSKAETLIISFDRDSSMNGYEVSSWGK